MQRKEQVIPSERIEKLIFLIRGQKVMLDSNLAELYDVPTKVFNQAVKRNQSRFASDFMFQLTSEEFDILRSQIATLETGRGRHRKYLPYAFTEQGVAMLSSILRSKRAVNVNIEIMRAFVRLREILATHVISTFREFSSLPFASPLTPKSRPCQSTRQLAKLPSNFS